MIDLEPRHLATVRAILAEFLPGCEVRAYGSRVKGASKPYSDLDLAIKAPDAVDAEVMRSVREAFENSDLPIRVEVVDWNAISEGFRRVIDEGYELI